MPHRIKSWLEDIDINIPKSDLKFFKQLAKKMGWTVETKDRLLKKFIASRPSDVDLSDEEILEELYKVRYKK